MTKPRKPRRRRRLLAAALVLAALVLFFLWSQNDLTTRTIEVAAPRLPAAFDGLRISLVSDVHGKEFGTDSARLLAAVAEQEPDLIAITGDLVDEAAHLDLVEPLARGLAAIAPTYYVAGNHEWSARLVQEVWEQLEGCGVTVLSNEYRLLERDGATIVLAGMEDANGYADQKTLRQLTEEIRAEQGDPYILLLAHRNNKWEDYVDCQIDLTLCGHAHGGLIRLPFTDGLIGNDRRLFPTYTSGLYALPYGQMVVSRGLGNNPYTFRLFNRPEVPLVVLRAGEGTRNN